ncbi:hypothetical protein MTF65_13590 [Streptomyces sp. APSN-46.1]|uniref:hypothetical protein n=1 Tax=Streptomyces sp. APSN-46.1 TaxID=2929049 RepID=UPI001FB235F8|nr:hypothetical protein [Streptomyces sp. APSN-46.1]MCJ1678363.1 hypothetical protein [Streptomyces sp. APSN-46.1]
MRDDHKNPPGDDAEAEAGAREDAGAREEQALRSLFSGAVQDIKPAEGALERLRYAVPARRARKRRVLVGAAAVALLAGTTVPAAMRLTGAEGTEAGHSAIAGHGQEQAGKHGADSDPHQNGSGGLAPTSTKPPGKGGGDADGAGAQPDPEAAGSPSGGAVAGQPSPGAATGTNPQPPVVPSGVPGCGAAQLGVRASARAPEADGKVFGSFKVTNVSGKGCAVTGPDSVTAAVAPGPATGGPSSAVGVVGHRAGDPASGLLTEPAAEVPVLMLAPNSAYEVQFAWVPSGEPCPATSPDPGAKPSDGTGAESGSVETGAAAGTDAAADPQTGGAPSPDPNGLAVSHTPVAGAPTTQTTIPSACGGTVYRTGVIPLDAPKP